MDYSLLVLVMMSLIFFVICCLLAVAVIKMDQKRSTPGMKWGINEDTRKK